MRYSIEFLRFLRYDVVRTVGFCSLFNFVADNMIESSFFTVSREEQVSTIQFRVSAWLIREHANIFLRPSSHTDLVPISMDSYWESILCHSIHGLLTISTIRSDGTDGNRISTNLRTEDRCRSILFTEEARVNLVHNETYKRCLSFVLENAIAELKSSVYGFFIRHACVFHVSNVGERSLDGFSRKRKAILSASELFDMLESSLQHDISLQVPCSIQSICTCAETNQKCNKECSLYSAWVCEDFFLYRIHYKNKGVDMLRQWPSSYAWSASKAESNSFFGYISFAGNIDCQKPYSNAW